MCSADSAVAHNIYHPTPNPFCTEHLHHYSYFILNKKKTIEDNRMKIIKHKVSCLLRCYYKCTNKQHSCLIETEPQIQMWVFKCDLCCQQCLVLLSPCYRVIESSFLTDRTQTALIVRQGQWLRGRQDSKKLPCSQVTVVWKPTQAH